MGIHVRTARTALLAAGALVTGLLTGVVAGSPAEAVAIDHWVHDDRPVGLPDTDVPARTVVSGEADHLIAHDGELDVTVELGAVPVTATDGDLHVVFGLAEDGSGCVPDLEIVVSTLSPGLAGDRDGTTMTLHRELDPYQGEDWVCSSVFVTAPDDPAVLDQLDGHVESTAFLDYLAQVNITEVTHTRLRPHRWSFVRVHLKNVGHDVQRVEVSGQGRGLSVGGGVVLGNLAPGDTYVLELPVRLDVREPRRLRLLAHPEGHDIVFTVDKRKRVWITPRRAG